MFPKTPNKNRADARKAKNTQKTQKHPKCTKTSPKDEKNTHKKNSAYARNKNCPLLKKLVLLVTRGGGVLSALVLGISRVLSPLGVRCSLFWWFCDVGCFSCLHGTGRSFCGLRQRARQRRPPATPASDARQRRLPAGHTKPPLDSKPAGYARSRSLMPPVTTTARTPRLRISRNATKAYFSLCQTTVGPASLLTGSRTGPVFWPLAL